MAGFSFPWYPSPQKDELSPIIIQLKLFIPISFIIDNPYHFQSGFWLDAVSGVPDWVRQSTVTYELLADMLDKDTLFDMIPDKTLKAFRQIMGKEPNWRKKTAAKCDVTFAVLKACLPVLK